MADDASTAQEAYRRLLRDFLVPALKEMAFKPWADGYLMTQGDWRIRVSFSMSGIDTEQAVEVKARVVVRHPPTMARFAAADLEALRFNKETEYPPVGDFEGDLHYFAGCQHVAWEVTPGAPLEPVARDVIRCLREHFLPVARSQIERPLPSPTPPLERPDRPTKREINEAAYTELTDALHSARVRNLRRLPEIPRPEREASDGLMTPAALAAASEQFAFEDGLRHLVAAGPEGGEAIVRFLEDPAEAPDLHRFLAAAALGDVAGPLGPGAVRALLVEHREDKDRDFVVALLIALAKREGSAASEVFLGFVDHRSTAVRDMAMAQLVLVADLRVFPQLWALWEPEVHRVRRKKKESDRFFDLTRYLARNWHSLSDDVREQVLSDITTVWDLLYEHSQAWFHRVWPRAVPGATDHSEDRGPNIVALGEEARHWQRPLYGTV